MTANRNHVQPELPGIPRKRGRPKLSQLSCDKQLRRAQRDRRRRLRAAEVHRVECELAPEAFAALDDYAQARNISRKAALAELVTRALGG